MLEQVLSKLSMVESQNRGGHIVTTIPAVSFHASTNSAVGTSMNASIRQRSQRSITAARRARSPWYTETSHDPCAVATSTGAPATAGSSDGLTCTSRSSPRTDAFAWMFRIVFLTAGRNASFSITSRAPASTETSPSVPAPQHPSTTRPESFRW